MKKPHQSTMKPPPDSSEVSPEVAVPAAAVDTPTGVFSAETLDKVVRLLCNIQDRCSIVAACLNKLGIPAENVDAAIDAAKEKLTRAADFHRDHELGRAITRLNELYQRSVAVQDVKTAIAAQRELNRLLNLYPNPYTLEGGEGDEDGTIGEAAQPPRGDEAAVDLYDAIDMHLEPLGLSDDEEDRYADIVRLAGAEMVRFAGKVLHKKRSKAPPPTT